MHLDNQAFETRIAALEAEIKKLREEIEAAKVRQFAPYIYEEKTASTDKGYTYSTLDLR